MSDSNYIIVTPLPCPGHLPPLIPCLSIHPAAGHSFIHGVLYSVASHKFHFFSTDASLFPLSLSALGCLMPPPLLGQVSLAGTDCVAGPCDVTSAFNTTLLYFTINRSVIPNELSTAISHHQEDRTGQGLSGAWTKNNINPALTVCGERPRDLVQWLTEWVVGNRTRRIKGRVHKAAQWRVILCFMRKDSVVSYPTTTHKVHDCLTDAGVF